VGGPESRAATEKILLGKDASVSRQPTSLPAVRTVSGIVIVQPDAHDVEVGTAAPV
jgi:hypothetical protein